MTQKSSTERMWKFQAARRGLHYPRHFVFSSKQKKAVLEEATKSAKAKEEAFEQSRKAFVHSTLALASEQARVARLLEGELVDLAVHIASAIIGSFEHEELAPRLAKEALSLLPCCKTATLRASPDAYQAIVGSHGERFQHEGVDVRVQLDHQMDDPGCVVETSENRIDARIRERLRMVARAIHEERASDV